MEAHDHMRRMCRDLAAAEGALTYAIQNAKCDFGQLEIEDMVLVRNECRASRLAAEVALKDKTNG